MGCLIRRTWKRDGETYRAPKWYGQYRDEHGKIRRVPLARDKRVANKMLDDLETAAERRSKGLPVVSDETRPIAEDVAEYRQSMRKQTAAYVAEKINRIEALVEACGFAWLGNIDPAGIERHLSDLAADRRNDDNEVVRGLSAKTINTYLGGFRTFVRWSCKRRGIIGIADRLDDIVRLDEKLDRRRVRRGLSVEDATTLIQSALRRPTEQAKFFVKMNGRKLTDEDRKRIGVEHALIYKMLMLCGLRVNELRTLRWEDVNLDAGWLNIRAEINKKRVARDVYLRADLIDDLKAWRSLCGDSRPKTLVLRVPINLARLLRKDLKHAGIEYRDARDRYCDNHAFRYTCNTWLSMAGVPDTIIKLHLGHKREDDMTAKYIDRRLIDMPAVVAKLPELPPVALALMLALDLVQSSPRMSKNVRTAQRRSRAS